MAATLVYRSSWTMLRTSKAPGDWCVWLVISQKGFWMETKRDTLLWGGLCGSNKPREDDGQKEFGFAIIVRAYWARRGLHGWRSSQCVLWCTFQAAYAHEPLRIDRRQRCAFVGLVDFTIHCIDKGLGKTQCSLAGHGDKQSTAAANGCSSEETAIARVTDSRTPLTSGHGWWGLILRLLHAAHRIKLHVRGCSVAGQGWAGQGRAWLGT